MNFCDSNTIVVGGADNERRFVCKWNSSTGRNAIYVYWVLGKSFAGEIFYCLPTGMPTYKDFMEVAGHMSARVESKSKILYD